MVKFGILYQTEFNGDEKCASNLDKTVPLS